MDSKTKKVLIIIATIIVIIVAIIFILRGNKSKENSNNNEVNFVEILEDGTKMNLSNKLKETKKIDGMEVSNIQLTERNNLSILLADVKNPTNVKKGGFFVNITLLNIEGNEIATIPGYIDEINPGNTVQLNSSVTESVSDAFDFIITKR